MNKPRIEQNQTLKGGAWEDYFALQIQRNELLAACKAIRDGREAITAGSHTVSSRAFEMCLDAIAKVDGRRQVYEKAKGE